MKNLNLKKKRKEKRGKLHRTAEPNVEAEFYNDNKNCD